jgi:hypothetical protein
MRKVVLNGDSFVQNQLKKINGGGLKAFANASEEISFFEDIKSKANRVTAEVSADDARNLDKYIEFLKARNSASTTMANNAGELADKTSSPIGIIIGMNHTNEVVDALRQAHRPVVVVTPYVKPPGGKEVLLSPEQMKARYKTKEPKTSALSDFTSKIKDPPNFNARWVQTKAELYGKIDDLVSAFFGQPKTMAGGGGILVPTNLISLPPDSPEFRKFLVSFYEKEGKGKNVVVDTTRLEITKTSKGTSIVFPIIALNPKGEKREYWIRAGRPGKTVASGPDPTEDEILRRLKSGEGPERSGEVENLKVSDLEVVDLTKNAKAVIAGSKDDALKADIFTD